MSKPMFLDFSGTECWMLNLLPFDDVEASDEQKVFNFQMRCLQDRVFGIGWPLAGRDYHELSESTIIEYANDWAHTYNNELEPTALKNALNNLKNVKPGHYIIMRLRNAHYYIGRVSAELQYDRDNYYEFLSWYGTVDKWVEFENDEELPSEIIGRFSRSRQPTIERIDPIRQRVLIIRAYENKLESGSSKMPRIRLTKHNFCRCMTYRDLEDLVCMYITKDNPGYMLLPSSCKLNQAKYEFTFVKYKEKPITCQVKNQAELPDVLNYIGDTSFGKIYLFSGLYSDAQCKLLKEQLSSYPHIIVISPQELYDSLSEFEYFLDKTSEYYELIDDTLNAREIFAKAGWQEIRVFRGNAPRRFSYDIDKETQTACDRTYIGSRALYYSEELNAIIHVWSEPVNRDVLSEAITLFEQLN